MRLFAAALLLIMFTYMGYAKTHAIRLREKILMAFAADITALAGEMQYRPREMPKLVKKLCRGELAEFWMDFSQCLEAAEAAEDAWNEAVWGCERLNVLTRAERALICEAGEGIGARGAGMQLQNAARVTALISKLADELHEETAKKGEMYKRLGMLMGMAAALMFI